MNELLEQAIIDANELKESALKAAEKQILDKYSDDIKKEFNKILYEQDELEGLGDDLDLGSLGDELGNDDPGELDPIAAQIPLAATDGENMCACPEENEEIEIDFAALAQKVPEEENMLDDDEPEINLDNLFEAVEAKDLEDVHQDEEPDELYDEVKDILESSEEDVELPLGFLDLLDFDEEEGKDANIKVDHEIGPSETTSGPTEPKKNSEEDLALAIDKFDSRIKESKNEINKFKRLYNKEKNLNEKLSLNMNKWKELAVNSTEKLKTYILENTILQYVNKVLETNSLNERQKKQIVESLKSVESVNEAKLIFESLVKVPPSTVKQKEGSNTLTEALNKTNRTLILKNTERNETKHFDDFDLRMLKLAGIKKDI